MNIKLEDYQNPLASGSQGGSFGAGSVEELNELRKALEAREVTGRDTTNLTGQSGAPLKLESLEKTLKVLTFSEADIVFWKRIPKKPAFNTVEEFLQVTNYGVERGGFTNEGELPEEETSEYIRRAAMVKFLGTTRAVTHPMALMNIAGSATAVEREIKNGTMWILRNLNKALYHGDSSLIPQEFDGLLTQQKNSDSFSSYDSYMNSDFVIDLRGKALTEAAIEEACNTVVENFGLANSLYAPPKVLSKFTNRFYGNKYFQVNAPGNPIGEARVGQRVKIFESQFGDVDLNKDIFFNKKPTKTTATSATSPKAPNAPTTGGAPSAVVPVGSDTLSKWTSADAGDYFYAVTAHNRYGESALTVLENAASTIVSGGAVDLTFTATASTYATTAYTIYRSNEGAASAASATFYPLFTISTAQLTAGYDGASAGSVRDRDRFMPDMNQMMILQENTDVIEFAQLLPLMKMDLAIVSPAYRFMILLYGTPFLYAPKKMVRIINIGEDLTA